jgi:hypothetical protein
MVIAQDENADRFQMKSVIAFVKIPSSLAAVLWAGALGARCTTVVGSRSEYRRLQLCAHDNT